MFWLSKQKSVCQNAAFLWDVSQVWLLVVLGVVRAGCPHCTTPPPSAILEMPPPPRLPSFPSWVVCHQHASFNGSAHSSGWWLMGPSSGGGDKAWPLAVVLVAGSATVLGSVLLLVLSKKKRWQPGRSSPGHHRVPAALLPSKGILVGASSLPAAGAYDNSAFAENVTVTGGGPPRASLLRQLQPPSLGGYRQLPHHHHHGPPLQ
ncbi:uncharacterized protein LOC119374186 isoform X1 [Rhipicephalus sanguineus]|uniref:uncharacterized protein LOC119374186 isoform X1 n=1 Tax=Rhipicephalus sanguineus TaxID=34632 RepID=UPI0018946022|nr:uncharacterized protein LOC119374186 isoform X1 [Rhipicephalus sanguineus]